jgi:hypothetical protein
MPVFQKLADYHRIRYDCYVDEECSQTNIGVEEVLGHHPSASRARSDQVVCLLHYLAGATRSPHGVLFSTDPPQFVYD